VALAVKAHLSLVPAREDRAEWAHMARFEAASFELTEMAAAGRRADALLELGLIYCAGREDVAIDLVSAHKWFNLAARSGNAEAKGYRMEIARCMWERA